MNESICICVCTYGCETVGVSKCGSVSVGVRGETVSVVVA